MIFTASMGTKNLRRCNTLTFQAAECRRFLSQYCASCETHWKRKSQATMFYQAFKAQRLLYVKGQVFIVRYRHYMQKDAGNKFSWRAYSLLCDFCVLRWPYLTRPSEHCIGLVCAVPDFIHGELLANVYSKLMHLWADFQRRESAEKLQFFFVTWDRPYGSEITCCMTPYGGRGKVIIFWLVWGPYHNLAAKHRNFVRSYNETPKFRRKKRKEHKKRSFFGTRHTCKLKSSLDNCHFNAQIRR